MLLKCLNSTKLVPLVQNFPYLYLVNSVLLPRTLVYKLISVFV